MFLVFEHELEYEAEMGHTLLQVVDTTSRFSRKCRQTLRKAYAAFYRQHARDAEENGEWFDGGVTQDKYLEHRVTQCDLFEMHLQDLFEAVLPHFQWMIDMCVESKDMARFVARNQSLMITSPVRTTVETMIGIKEEGDPTNCILHSDVFFDEEICDRLIESLTNLFKYHFTEVKRLIYRDSFRVLDGVYVPRLYYEELQILMCMPKQDEACAAAVWMRELSPELWLLIWTLAQKK